METIKDIVLSETEQINLSGIFKKASILELAFWNMAYGD